MSLYHGFMAATQAATAVHSRRAALASQELLDRHDAAAERQVNIEARRQTLFQAAEIVREAQSALGTSPAAAYYLVRRIDTVLDRSIPGAFTAADFPELQDKAFLSQATGAYQATRTAAQQRIDEWTHTATDRLVWLDAVRPLLRSYAAWRDVRGVLDRGFNPKPQTVIVGLGLPLLLVIFGGTAIRTMIGFLGSTLSFLIAYGGTGYLALRWLLKQGKQEGEVRRILEAVGETMPADGSVDAFRAHIKHLAQRLVNAGVDRSIIERGDVRAEAARLDEEHAALWRQVFAEPNTLPRYGIQRM